MKYFPAPAFMLLAALPAFLASRASAAPVPQYLPDRDVSITYALTAPGRGAQNYQLEYNAAGGLARIEAPAQGIFVLANLPSGQAQVVVPFLHAFVEAPDFSGLTRMISHADGAHFTPLGHDHYAGLGCETYKITDRHGDAIACLTHDGLILHFTGHDGQGSAEVTALSVNFAPQPPGDFSTPNGFSEISLPPGALAALLQPH